jgi:hypothetical protein
MVLVKVASGSAERLSKYSKERKAQDLENRLISLESEVQNRKAVDNIMLA